MAVFLSCQHFGLMLQVFCFLYNYFKGCILWDVKLGGLFTLKIQPFFFHDAWVTSFTQPLHRHGSISQHCPERLSLRKTCLASLLPQSLAFQPQLPTNYCWTLSRSSNIQSPVYNNAKSVFCCQPLVYNNAKSVFCCWNVLFIMGHVQITWIWRCGDTHQLICQKLPHKCAICHTSNMWFRKSPSQTKMQIGLFYGVYSLEFKKDKLSTSNKTQREIDT